MADKPPCGLRPELRPFARSLRFSEWPQTPQLDSGHLAVSNRGWRTLWPEVIAENCNYCSLCFVYCPDAAITLDAKGLPEGAMLGIAAVVIALVVGYYLLQRSRREARLIARPNP